MSNCTCFYSHNVAIVRVHTHTHTHTHTLKHTHTLLWGLTDPIHPLTFDPQNTSATRTMVEPMKKFSAIFPGIYVALKKREQLLQEYSRCQGKLEKYQDKERTGQNLAKLEAVSLSFSIKLFCISHLSLYQWNPCINCTPNSDQAVS